MDFNKYNLNKDIYYQENPLLTHDKCLVMAGPCAVESREQILYTADKLSAMGITVFRAGAFKPRTSYGAFMGAGEDGLKWLEEVKKDFGMMIITETSDTENFKVVSEVTDIIQIGAKAMYNYSLLKSAGRQEKPVLLKRHFGSTVEEMVRMSEFIVSEGCHDLAYCERGIRTFENKTRFTLDICGAEALKHMLGLPLVLDPSHSMGYAYGVPDIAKACIALGCEGVLIEVHHNPGEAMCDKEQALTIEQFRELYGAMKRIGEAIGKEVI